MLHYYFNIPVLTRKPVNGEEEFEIWTEDPDGEHDLNYGPRVKSGEVRNFCETYGIGFEYYDLFRGSVIYAYTPAEQVHFKLMFGVEALLASEWALFQRREWQRKHDRLNRFEAYIHARCSAKRAA